MPLCAWHRQRRSDDARCIDEAFHGRFRSGVLEDVDRAGDSLWDDVMGVGVPGGDGGDVDHASDAVECGAVGVWLRHVGDFGEFEVAGGGFRGVEGAG